MKTIAAALMVLVVSGALVDSLLGQMPDVNRSIVVLKAGVLPANVIKKHGVVPVHQYEHSITGFAAVIPPGIMKKLQADPDVAWIEPDQVCYTTGKPPQPSKQVTPVGIQRIGARENAKAKIDGIDERVDADVAIIDTGIDLSHPDLNVYRNVTFVAGTRTGKDDYGHGTHVAGTVAAIDNTIGVVGVAPGARLWAVKVLNRNGNGSWSDVIKGVDYVAANAASIEVANMSLGGPDSPAVNVAIRLAVEQGVVFVVSAGNYATDAATTTPANSPDVLTVSAMVDTDGIGGGDGSSTNYGADDTFASFSNYGEVVDIAAPGVNVVSTYINRSYASMSGTSMAAPHVTGAVALYLANGLNKPSNDVGVHNVMDAIKAAGTPQLDLLNGFTGDPDGFAEPLLNASEL